MLNPPTSTAHKLTCHAVWILLCLMPLLAAAQPDPLAIDAKGNVGIGTNAPKARLHVAGDLGVNGFLDLGIGRTGRDSLAGKIGYGLLDSSALSIIGAGAAAASHRIHFYNEGGAAMNGPLNISGNVGIGTSSVPTEKLQVNGRIKDLTGYVVPIGGIIMFSGVYANLFDGSGLGKSGTPVEGWALCNGKNNTPNLLDRFIVGAGASYGNDAGSTGGSNTKTLSIAQMPAHAHNYTQAGLWGGGNIWSHSYDSWGQNSITTQSDTVGNSQPFDIRPPYYALFYIMKL